MRSIISLLIILIHFFSHPAFAEYYSPPQNNHTAINGEGYRFNPRFAGPSASNVAPGEYYVQSFLFVTDTYAVFDNHRNAHSISDVLMVNPVFLYGTGLNDWLDFNIILEAFYFRESKTEITELGDQQIQFGIQVSEESDHRPAIRIAITETFPIGKFKGLRPELSVLAAPGDGSFQTSLAFNIAKVFWKKSKHPTKLRSTTEYTIPTSLHVTGFNSYGGGFGTNGRVSPGNNLLLSEGMEITLSKTRVLAFDFRYYYYYASPFSGKPGVDRQGNPAIVGLPSGDELSGAVLIEYNPTDSFSFVAGVWSIITGRNTGAFIGTLITAVYTW